VQYIVPVQEDDNIVVDERWALVNRVVSSRGFSKAGQLRELLLYIARIAIESPSAEITEQEIGCRVLGRRPDYDTQADNIVRVQVRHLRQKLEEYFAGDGQDEPILLSIPKGRRALVFEMRPVAQPEPTLGSVAPAVPAAAAASRKLVIAGCVAGLVAVLAGAFLAGRLSASAVPGPTRSAHRESPNPLWRRLFTHDQPTTIVIADSTLVVLQDLLGTNLTLDEYVAGAPRKLIEKVASPELRAALWQIAGRQHTSLADATLSGKLYELGRGFNSNVSVRYSRNMNVRDFNTGNFILIGSKRGIPWIDLFESDMNFLFDRFGPDRRFGFRNKRPAAGEAGEYSSLVRSDGHYQAFATISLVPNLTRTGSVLLLAGVSMEATEAAGEFTMSNSFDKLIAQVSQGSTSNELPYFEALIRTEAVSGAPHKIELVASRRPALD
jgi:hypothetical protein